MKTLSVILLLVGSVLLLINGFGLTQSLRPNSFEISELRFGGKDISLTLDNYKQQIKRKAQESLTDYSVRLTQVIANGTAHIHWNDFEPKKFNQLVPIWENWILFLMGKYSGIKEYKRYHFVTPEKSIERGIGICGEVSMLMSSLLARESINSTILTYPGHVVVTAEIDGEHFVFDPDFGIVIHGSPDDLIRNPALFNGKYLEAGYSHTDELFFQNAYSQVPGKWKGAKHFITKKYYFEKISYWAKWLVPVLMLFSGLLLVQPFRSRLL